MKPCCWLCYCYKGNDILYTHSQQLDNQFYFSPETLSRRALEDRLRIVKAIGCVNISIPSVDKDSSVVQTLNILHTKYSLEWDFDEMIFANGGDRKEDNIPEYKLCEDRGIRMAFNVGGGKTESSSTLLGRVSGEK